MISDLWRTAINALELIAEHTASVNPWWAALGVVLYLAAQAVRTRGWHTILIASYPEAEGELKPRHTMAAYLAGAGLNGVVPARGGDVVKLALLHRRIKDSRYTTLAATFVPETLFETAFGIGLVVWALANGFLPVPTSSGELPQIDVSLLIAHPVRALAIIGSVAVIGFFGIRWALRRVQDFRQRLAQGLAILGDRRRFITGVASWQALARLIRLCSLAAFMAAFALPVTLSTVVLVMAAQGGGRIIPLAPASAGLRLVMLSYGFVEVTGQVVDIAAITAFTVGVGVLLMLAGLLVGLICLAAELEIWSPRKAVSAMRALARRPAPAAGTPV